MQIALITGITGQDGSYLAELLLEKGYEVHGIVRRSSLINTHRIDHIYDQITLHYGDLTDSGNLISLVQKIKPTEVYNLAAMSHVKVSFEMPEYVGEVDALGHCVSWMLFVCWIILASSTRHLPVNCMDWCKRGPSRERPHPSIHAHPMV